MKIFIKHIYKRLLIFVAFFAALSVSSFAALTSSFYTTKSVLSEGKWVKVGVEKTGVYEISYETLKEMGFNDPPKVSVYGRGGRMLPESFVSNSGVPIITDDLAPVKIIHEGNKLYFYGLGPEEITFETNSEYNSGGCFKRISNNIYSRRGYYFLTDTKDVALMMEKNYDTSSAYEIDKGVSYIYHEIDSVQNFRETGQLFWGESFNLAGNPKRKWDVYMPGAIAEKGVMHCESYIQGVWFDPPVYCYGFEGMESFVSKPYKESSSLYFTAQDPVMGEIDVPGEFGRVFVGFDDNTDTIDFANLDFWVVSYQSVIPSLNVNQQLIAFPSIAKNTTAKIILKDCSSYVVLDVSNETDPQRLKITQSGATGTVGVRYVNKSPVLVFFDKTQPQLQISGYDTDYQQIANQNLHAFKDEGADFIIITTPAFKSYAERIADLHKEYDGIKTVVATTEECYNEFSGGVPDPMAYRSFAKMLYFNTSCKPKNVLLLGPLYGDYRGMGSERDPSYGIIAYQSPAVSKTRGAHNINDFYGMMSDKFRTDYYERNDVQLGVGVLPVKFDSEARIIVDKIEKYLKRDDHAYFLNMYTGVSGIGDAHTHDIQIRDLYNHIRNLDYNGMNYTPLAIDTYGNSEARTKFINQLNNGCNMFSYFGHGAEQFLGKNRFFFNAGDVNSLRNTSLPLGLFGGCQLTNTDRGVRGLGESLVTNTPYGCIGTILSARDTWSGQNYEFFKQFFTCLMTEGSTVTAAHRDNPVSIGEVYAKVKDYSTYANELSYQLLCDPALIIPIINRSVEIDDFNLIPGESVEISGKVVKSDKQLDSNFNGKLVMRLNEPTKTFPMGNVESKEEVPVNGMLVYRDEQLSMSAAEVSEGRFKVSIYVPSSLESYEGQEANLFFSVFDPSSKVGGASGYAVKIGSSKETSSESRDNIPPVINELAFNNNESSIYLSVSDNLALNLSRNPLNKGLYLYIDGKERIEAHFSEPMLANGSSAYRKKVYIDNLAYGEHTARLKIKDVAGNFSEQEIIFTYQPVGARYLILRNVASGPKSTIVEIDSTIPAQASLVVLSSNGEEVWRGDFTGNSIEWNHVNHSGAIVEPGHYKGYLIETGSKSFKGHADPIDLPVI